MAPGPHPDLRLPPELERNIFEIVTLSARPSSIPTLTLVAARVKAWVEPILYRIVVCSKIKFVGFPVSTLTADTLLRLATTTVPHKVLQNSIQNLFLNGFPVSARVDAILTACSPMTNLFAHFKAAPALSAIHCLSRLTIDATALMEPSALTVPHPMFRTLTHLDLTSFESAHVHTDSVQAGDSTHARGVFCFVSIEETTDFRLDWLRGADTRKDYWALAERFIVARRAGKCNRE
ncbi:hypothetical protein B0H13DRAFT_2345410 [Mycena leptocephala]|nr:hypothetical protein B0H13DRAFT_2345410 [Mycena leptocephala]